ncbi:capsule biosynthesis protein [Sulfitobacter alexandrii]|uniref:Capsule biosynthesis protein n=1 Tax=Sulfitobacter alexandrii TaxID=1917485 RepID=A0A1J0WE52_9RHOB|nr:capsule biosynthesis protein [Sulfitobacter alexandrii]APE42594.1 capsule biosynthesis protein [Sulfitobacter alexandrii]
MTTKPKARKFRIKRSAPPPPQGLAAAAENNAARETEPVTLRRPQPQDRSDISDRPGGPRAVPDAAMPPERPAPTSGAGKDEDTASSETARTGEVSSASEVAGELDMDAIRREGLTGRQLRMARRVAQKHGLAPTSDFDAVRLLRARGIDPFQRSNMLELVVPQAGGEHRDGAPGDIMANLPAQRGGAGQGRVQLPQTVPAGGGVNLPSTELSPAQRREREIGEIQRDISRRRRRKLGLLMVRLAFFVMLPTFAAGYYFYKVATPMYATTSQFMLIQSEGTSTSPFGGLLPTQFANSQDSIATQAYLQSKDAMLRLDQDVGFKSHFTDDSIDPIQRLTDDPTNEEAYKVYKKNVKIGYDPTEGVIRMEVVAADPEVSTDFSRHLLEYAEERVNNLSKKKREDGMADAVEGLELAQQNRRDVQQRLIELQVQNGVDPEAEIVAIRSQITTYEGLLIEKELELAALLDNIRPNKAKVDGAQGDVRRINDQLDKLNDRLNSATQGDDSLAKKAVELQLAQADLVAADANLQLAQTGLEAARAEANRQVRYLTVAVEPVAPQEPTYPRKFENTILAFLIFAGIYLMLSLTAAILREQVTS